MTLATGTAPGGSMPEVVAIDYGHSGIVGGQYVTAGKQYRFTDSNPTLWVGEGLINRAIAAKVFAKLIRRGVRVFDCVALREWTRPPSELELEQRDTALSDRVAYANELWTAYRAPFVSIHSNAIGSKASGPSLPARGASVFTSPGSTRSDRLAARFYDALRTVPGQPLQVRKGDWSDGDEDHEARFYVLTKTKGTAVLCEFGFFTNRQDAEILLSQPGQDAIARVYARALTE